MKLSNSAFDVLKWIAILLLPSLATLVAVIFKIWNLPYGNEIAQTITALAAFLGAILGISSVQYKKGKNNGRSAI